MIRLIGMICGRCSECLELDQIVESSAEILSR